MGKEIERKFRVTGDGWRGPEGTDYRQGYLNTDKARTVRVRIEGGQAKLTVKGLTHGATRAEYEYDIPLDDAREMLEELCQKPLIEKRRHEVEHGGLTWEVDEFAGVNEGLVIAEVELESENQSFDKPDWIGEEVTSDPRYYNSNLVDRPYSEW